MSHDRHFRLREVDIIWYQMPLKRPYGTARGVTTHSINFLVMVTAEGSGRTVRGIGECQPRHALTGDGGKDRTAAWDFLRAAADWLRDRTIECSDPSTAVKSVRDLMRDLQPVAAAHADDSNRAKPYRGTMLGIEVALLDAAARALDLQLSELLGKQRDEIGISISTIGANVDLTEVPERVIKQQRFPMTRVKGVGDLSRDLVLLETVAQANRSVGREKPLWIDINEGLQYEDAAALLREIAGRMSKGILPTSVVVEGMLPKADFVRLAELQQLADVECAHLGEDRGLNLRIMPDEGLWDVDDLRQLISAGGCRAINIKAPKAGGLLASLDLARAAVADRPDIHLCIGGMVGTSDITAWTLHNLARALPRIDYLTAIPPTNVEERISDPLARYVAKGSNIIAPQILPGLGTSLRLDKLAPYIKHSTLPQTESTSSSLVIEQVSDDTSTKVISFGGDTSLGDVYVQRQGGDLLSRLQHDPMSFLSGLQPLVAGSDAMILNLETVLADSPSSPFEGKKPYLGWDNPERTVECLRQLGVVAVSLANNHSMDYGATHLLETKAYLEKAGISSFGAGANRKEAAAPLTLRLDVDGGEQRVHLIAGMQIQAKLRDEYQFYASPRQPGVNGLARSRLVKTIEQLREQDPNSLIVVFPHWGRNYQWANDKLRAAAEDFASAGADLIIGHGAHMLQQCTFDKHTATVYSLGNFLFNWAGRFDKYDAPPYGLVARVGLDYKDGRWQVQLRLYPILSDNQRSGHRPSPVDEQGFRDVWAALTKMDLDGSFARHARAARDSLGYHIAFSFETEVISVRDTVEM